MIVSIKSQCDKKALKETRRILDQFFERSGDRSWEGHVTQQGLTTVRKLLRKSARRNTAIACHRVRGALVLDLEWIVGNAKRFNATGKVPTNSTTLDVLRVNDENQWHTAEVIALTASIAGLFHDFGKANLLFQKKLKSKKVLQEPLRHEWLSLLMFACWVEGKTDKEWLESLVAIGEADEQVIGDKFSLFQKDRNLALSNPFTLLPPLAKFVGWLVVSHHRLPIYPRPYSDEVDDGEINDNAIKLAEIDLEKLCINNQDWDASWNSRQCLKQWPQADWHNLFELSEGTPFKSAAWRKRASGIAKRALNSPSLLSKGWLEEDNFTSHLARLSLMLADHSFSALPPVQASPTFSDKNYIAYANTYKDEKGRQKRKQRLDEHNIGVGQNAYLLARQLPKLRSELPSLGAHKALKKRTTLSDYTWQNKAYETALSIAERTEKQGFFGINMASTGKGKTFANARIMYGVSNEIKGCRFSVALGLRTLTLQTGDALRSRLQLDTDELAVLVGSQAVQELHEQRQSADVAVSPHLGSESAADLMDAEQHIVYDGSLDNGPLRRWLGSGRRGMASKALKLLSAPVLVSTIDHLISATEGVRGGKQIAPMLRLLTSDLVLDEPDDFGSDDLPALCRLVNWAGLLGSKVLLSSASLPPVFVRTLFEAYLAGRKQYEQACGISGQATNICCAWFDEFVSSATDCATVTDFQVADRAFVDKRIEQLKKQNQPAKALRKGEILPLPIADNNSEKVIGSVIEVLVNGIKTLHLAHCETDPKTQKQASLGLVRFANINPLTAIALQLAATELSDDWQFHVCVYHSQFPLLVRSFIEARLDNTLDRHDAGALWKQPEVRNALDKGKAKHHVFIVLGSPVTEVGRDHDYSWAIAEPSSARSIIQLAGRVQRHRKQVPDTPNVLILEHNTRALKGDELAYCKPGFEALSYNKQTKTDGNDLLLAEEYRSLAKALNADDLAAISSIPRIEQRKDRNPRQNLVDLEHAHLNAVLRQQSRIGIKNKKAAANQWWENGEAITWCAEMQRLSSFRKSAPDEAFILYLADEAEAAVFGSINEQGDFILRQKEFESQEVVFTTSVQPWLETTMEVLLFEQAERFDKDVASLSKRFGEIRLGVFGKKSLKKWLYHPWLGIHKDFKS